MKHRKNIYLELSLIVCISFFSGNSIAAETDLLPVKGDRIAFIGDSITAQKIYSKYVEAYFKACVPQLELTTMQFGRGGETAAGFNSRLKSDVLPWKPTMATICYGMNDGGYAEFNEETGEKYIEPLQKIVFSLKEARCKVLVSSPGVVDTQNFPPSFFTTPPLVYNKTLAKMAGLARRVAEENSVRYADMNGTMMDAMKQSKKVFGDAYHIAGEDGIHPDLNGHLVMAYAMLKAMGFDGKIANIAIDMGGKAEVSQGHKLVSQKAGKIIVESTRYPFCFYGKRGVSNSTVDMPDFVPFNEELNRFMLSVKNLDGEQAIVRWGDNAEIFTKSQLSDGVNLAAEFTANPFSEPFQGVLNEIAKKQAYEDAIVRLFITNIRFLNLHFKGDKEMHNSLMTLRKQMLSRHLDHEQKIRAAIKPVRHIIEIIPVK